LNSSWIIKGELGCACLVSGGPDSDRQQLLIGGEKKELAAIAAPAWIDPAAG